MDESLLASPSLAQTQPDPYAEASEDERYPHAEADAQGDDVDP